MIDIVGNITITSEERLKYLVACIRSYQFLEHRCRFVLQIDHCNDKIASIVSNELQSYDHLFIDSRGSKETYGYSKLLQYTRYDYVINFMEDHFMVCDSVDDLNAVLLLMKAFEVDVCKASFYDIEKNSGAAIVNYGEYIYNGCGVLIFENNFNNFDLYQSYYKKRYYVGVNFLTTRNFAKKFWSREMGAKPHDYEIARYSDDWKHRCMLLPGIELQASIDDDHGEKDTCLLKRGNEKWNRIWSDIW